MSIGQNGKKNISTNSEKPLPKKALTRQEKSKKIAKAFAPILLARLKRKGILPKNNSKQLEEVSSFFDEMSKAEETPHRNRRRKTILGTAKHSICGNKRRCRAVNSSAQALHEKQAVADGERVPLKVLNNYKTMGGRKLPLTR